MKRSVTILFTRSSYCCHVIVYDILREMIGLFGFKRCDSQIVACVLLARCIGRR